MLEQWVRITRKLNPGVDVLIVDSASPAFPTKLDEKSVVRTGFPDNIGALAKGGRDGWGRAFCRGLQVAIELDVEWVAFIECDLLFARSVQSVIDRMLRCSVKAACPMAAPYGMIETALTFMDVRYMRDIDFIARYGWETAPVTPLCEFRVEQLLGDRFMALPLRGARDDMKTLTPRNLLQAYPEGIDYLTHASPALFRSFLEMNGLQEP